MIADFNNVSDFDVDIKAPSKGICRGYDKGNEFALSAALAGNAYNADPTLDRIRALRNNEECKDYLFPKAH